ncbi:hypothetical protein EBT16_05445, partial [bacterium]|nr:hypothetical protein [bacterium]
SADSIEVLGHCDIKDKNLTIYSFQVTVPKDEYPEDCNDPDEECDEFRWVNPEVISPEILTNLHSPENVTLQLLGLQEKTLRRLTSKGRVRELFQKSGCQCFCSRKSK